MTILKLLAVINKKLKNPDIFLRSLNANREKELVVGISRGRDESRDGRHVSSHQAFQPIVNRRQDDVYAQWRSAKNDRVGIYHILVGKYMNDEEDPSSFPLVYWEKNMCQGPLLFFPAKMLLYGRRREQEK